MSKRSVRSVAIIGTVGALVGATAVPASAGDVPAGFRILHSFGNAPHDGWQPWGSPTMVDGDLIGRTTYGGTHQQSAVIWRMNPRAPSSYHVIHNFGRGDVLYADNSHGRDIANPHHDWLRLGPNGHDLYGAGLWGSNGGQGGVFRIDLNDNSYRVLHAFGGKSSNNPHGSPTDGAQPHSNAVPIYDPVTHQNALFGLTAAGGTKGDGTLYRMGLDGSGFHLLHSFVPNGGDVPHGFVIRVADSLYGMTRLGGFFPSKSNFTSKSNYKLYKHGNGVIWSYNLTSHKYAIMHRFSYGGPLASPSLPGGVVDGAVPDHGGLFRVGSRLYGLTTLGGTNQGGVIFSIKINGSGYRIEHTFAAPQGARDVSRPHGTLMPGQGGWLYALGYYGGIKNAGGIFRFRPSARRYQMLYSFRGGASASNGIDNPVVGTLPSGQTAVYGMTEMGGKVTSTLKPTPTAPDYKPNQPTYANGTIWRLVVP